MMDNHVCPSCLLFWDVEPIDPEWRLCPNCNSEAIAVELMPLREFLGQVTTQHLESYRRDWLAEKGSWVPAWWKSKLDQLDALIAMKKEAG